MPQVLIEWQEGGPEAATWEDVATMKVQFLDFHLDDKVVQRPASNDRVLRVLCQEERGRKQDVRWVGGGSWLGSYVLVVVLGNSYLSRNKCLERACCIVCNWDRNIASYGEEDRLP